MTRPSEDDAPVTYEGQLAQRVAELLPDLATPERLELLDAMDPDDLRTSLAFIASMYPRVFDFTLVRDRAMVERLQERAEHQAGDNPVLAQPPGGLCHYCAHPGQRLAPCCDRPEHEHQLACVDVAGCRDRLLEQIEAYQEAEYMAEPEGYCITCGANLAHFFGYQGPQHFRGPHKLVTGLERRELFDADHEPVIAWREAGDH